MSPRIVDATPGLRHVCQHTPTFHLPNLLFHAQILPPDPRFPFVEGSYQNLNDAFDWAEKYGIGVWLDYHAHNGSQNGYVF